MNEYVYTYEYICDTEVFGVLWMVFTPAHYLVVKIIYYVIKKVLETLLK